MRNETVSCFFDVALAFSFWVCFGVSDEAGDLLGGSGISSFVVRMRIGELLAAAVSESDANNASSRVSSSFVASVNGSVAERATVLV